MSNTKIDNKYSQISITNTGASWDIPIELSGAVYKALHKIQSLRDLRIRLDVQATKTVVHQTSLSTNHPSNTGATPIQLAPSYTFPVGTSHSNYPPGKLLNQKIKNSTRYDYWGNGRVLSPFKNLKSLTLLGISDHGCLTEIAECLKSSSTSLRSLTLSISQDLAIKSRTPLSLNLTTDDPSESDPDEDEDTLDASPQPTITTKQQFNEADIRREKVAQEAILAKVFGLQGVSEEGKKLEKKLAILASSGVFEDPDRFTQDAKVMMRELVGCYRCLGGSMDNDRRRAFLESTVKAAERFLNTHPKQAKKPIQIPSKPPNQTSNIPPMPLGSVPPAFNIGDFGIPGSALASSSGQWFLGSNLPSTTTMASGSGPSGKVFSPDGTVLSDSCTPAQAYLLGSTGSFPMSHSGSPIYPSIHGPPSIPPKVSSLSKGPYHHFPTKKSGLSSMFSHPSSTSHTSASADSWDKMYAMPNRTSLEAQEKFNPDEAAYDMDYEEESEPDLRTTSLNKPVLFPASETTGEVQVDSMDIDMEHPDEDLSDIGADQEIIAETEEVTVSPRKRTKFEVMEPPSPVPSSLQTGVPGTSSAAQESDPSHSIEKSPDEAMQDYIRSTHGLQLEEFCLYLIPLKASIVARGLDLNALKSLTLLIVGSQDPFWLLLTRLQNRSIHVHLESIHTDDVSSAFLEFLKTFEGLKELFMQERSTKDEIDPITRTRVDITGIRKKGLQKHIKTLTRLVIKNENDESWDLDPKTIALLSARGGALRELAISMSMESYVSLLVSWSTRWTDNYSISSCRTWPHFKTSQRCTS